jgi:integrase
LPVAKKNKGSGSIKQLRGKYYARWRHNGKDFYGPPRDNRDEAELDRLTSKPAFIGSKHNIQSIPSVLQFTEMCLNVEDTIYGYYARGIQPSTLSLSKTILNNYIANTSISSMRIDRIEVLDVDRWIREIQCKQHAQFITNSSSVKGSKISASFVRRCHALLSKIFSIAVRYKLIKSNPCSGAILPRVVERHNVHISNEQLQSLYTCTSKIACLMIVAAETGLRRSELIRLRWQDFSSEGILVTNTKNGFQQDLVPLTSKARQCIESQPRTSEFVFCSKSGKPLSERNVSRDVKKLMETLGFPRSTRLHDLRGKFLTDLIEAGVDIKTVQVLARHTDSRTTMKFYLRTNEKAKKKAVQKLNSIRKVKQPK